MPVSSVRFVVTGSGRCGTHFMSRVLTHCGVPCGHEQVYGQGQRRPWDGFEADSSWMAAALGAPEPTVLLVRDPMAVVTSWVEIGFFGWQQTRPGNVYHDLLRRFAPHVYDWPAEHDRALAMWLALNEAALPRAEMLLRLEQVDAERIGRLLRWAGHDDRPAGRVLREIHPSNRHEILRERTGVRYQPSWARHDPVLAAAAGGLARLLGYEAP